MGNALNVATLPPTLENHSKLKSQDDGDVVSPTQLRSSSPVLISVAGCGTQHWRSARLFRDLSPEDCQQIVAAAVPRHYRARQVIVREADRGSEVLLLASGRVKVTQISHTGDEVILRIKSAGEVIGGLGMSRGETHSSTIQTLERCGVLTWKLEQFDVLCERFPLLHRNSIQILNDTLQILQECFCELATLRVPSRLARTLVRLVEQDASGARNAPITLTCEELGQMTGTTLFTVSRLLCKWTEIGLLYPEHRAIMIKDMGGLLAIADGELSA